MRKEILLISSLTLAVVLAGAAQTRVPAPAATAALSQGSAPAVAPKAHPAFTAQDARRVLDQYCVRCHNENFEVGKRTKVMWEKVDVTHLSDYAETVEKGVRKLRAGLMPPPGQLRPDPETYAALRDWFESELDRTVTPLFPPPGLHRMNRTEYGNAIRDLLALEVDATRLLPADDSSSGFDNMAGTLGTSPTLLEAYLSAASKISRLAVGTAASPTQAVYRVPEDATQDYHVEGLPFGTRGGLVVQHEFPSDGDYELRVVPVNKGNMGNNAPFGEVRGEKLEVVVDGERVQLLDWDRATGRNGSLDVKFKAKSGPHTIGVTFVATNYAPGLDLNEHFMRSTIETGGLPGYTFFPHVGSFRISGPFNATAAQDTPSRRRIFVCRPANANDEASCAQKIISTLARRAYRQPAAAEDIQRIMDFYQIGRKDSTFDHGIQTALQRILAEPKFIYRVEREPANVAVGKGYRISDIELASRLSFFLWSSIPDDTLLDIAIQGKLKDPVVLEQQVRRMLADPKSSALVENFAGQWLALRNLQSSSPVVQFYPDFDDNLRQAFRRESELFFESIIREDRNVLNLLDADYTFVNERLAKHYGIPNVYGSNFRRVTLGDGLDARRGLLGKGSSLTVSARPDRNSLVMRGKWVFQTILGVPAPAPPPGVVFPPFQRTDAAGNTRAPTLREQMEMHRSVEPCKSCHQLMDPFGNALENFNAIGMWRTMDGDSPVNANDVLYDGTKVHGVASARDALLTYSGAFVRNLTTKLLTYGLGRGVEYYDMPVVRSIVRDADRNDDRFSSLILGVVKSAPFQMNTKMEAK